LLGVNTTRTENLFSLYCLDYCDNVQSEKRTFSYLAHLSLFDIFAMVDSVIVDKLV
jgi:hypothetical protein